MSGPQGFSKYLCGLLVEIFFTGQMPFLSVGFPNMDALFKPRFWVLKMQNSDSGFGFVIVTVKSIRKVLTFN